MIHIQGRPQGGENFPRPQPERGTRRPHEGPFESGLNTCLEDRYTLMEQSFLNTLIEQSQYSSEKQRSKFINKEIWLVRGSYRHCEHVLTFFSFFLVFHLSLGEVMIQNGNLLALGAPL